MSVQSKPTVVIVPGAATYAWMYDDVKAGIVAAGHEVVTLQLRTVDVKTPPATTQDDVEYVHSQLEKLVSQNKEVIVVMHSYGGAPGTEAAKGLVKTDRVKEGMEGGIIRLVYVASFAPAVGESLGAVNQREGLTFDFIKIEGDYFVQEPEGSAKINFSDLPLEKGIEEVKKMPPHSLHSFGGELTYPAYNFVPVSYVKTTHDQCLPPWWQDNRIKTVETSSGNPVDVHIFEADHCCNASKPAELADIIVKIAASHQ